MLTDGNDSGGLAKCDRKRHMPSEFIPIKPSGLLLDSGGVDVIMSYNAICTSRIILEGLVFQEPYKRGEPSKRPCEHKTLESNKSLLPISRALGRRHAYGCALF